MLLGEEKRLDNFAAGKSRPPASKICLQVAVGVCLEFDQQKRNKK